MAPSRKPDGIEMLITAHALHVTQPFPFTPASWELVSNSTFGVSNVNAVTKGLGRFVAVGGSGRLATSENATTWSARTSSFGTSSIYAVGFGQGRFVAGGSTGKLATSTDGIVWAQRSSSFGSSVILTVTYSASQNIWVAAGGSGKLATSEDGISWTQRTSSFGTSFIRSIYTIGNTFVAVGDDGKLATSTNGISWTQRTSSFSITSIYDVSSNANGTFFVAVGDTGKIAYSSNATTWTQNLPLFAFGSTSIRAIDGSTDPQGPFLAGGANGKVASSFDGEAWAGRNSQFGSSTINDVFFDTSLALIVGNSGKIAYGF